jgi:predicted Holliday junction resolvase-like endonuclease
MDEKEENTKQAEESEIVREVDEAGDEEMLERLLKVNEAIEKIESNGEMAAVKNPDEVVRQKVAEVLRKLEAEIVMNKFDDVLTKE